VEALRLYGRAWRKIEGLLLFQHLSKIQPNLSLAPSAATTQHIGGLEKRALHL
jgi:hypothetical protein